MAKNDRPESSNPYAVFVRTASSVPVLDAQVTWNGIVGASPNKDGGVFFNFPASKVRNTTIQVKARGYKDYTSPAFTMDHPNQAAVIGGTAAPSDIALPNLTPLVPEVSKLIIGRNGSVAGFYLPGGQRFIYKGVTEFSLFKMFLDGTDIDPVLNNRARSRVLRVLGEFSGPGFTLQLIRKNEPQFYNKLAPFASYLASRGFYLEFTVFADITQNQTFDHLDRVVSAFEQAPNVLIEVANEPMLNFVGDQQGALDWGRKIMNRGFLIASGSYDGNKEGDQDKYFKNCCNYITYHGTRAGQNEIAPKFYRDDVDAICNVAVDNPVVHDEPIGFGPVRNGSRDNNVKHAFILGTDLALRLAGGTFHSDNGIESQIFDSETQACYDAFMKGMEAVENCAIL